MSTGTQLRHNSPEDLNLQDVSTVELGYNVMKGTEYFMSL
jgi:hypothetical protein